MYILVSPLRFHITSESGGELVVATIAQTPTQASNYNKGCKQNNKERIGAKVA